MRFLLENFVCVLARIVSLITEHAYQQRIKNRTISFSHVSQHTLSDKTISDKSDVQKRKFYPRKVASSGCFTEQKGRNLLRWWITLSDIVLSDNVISKKQSLFIDLIVLNYDIQEGW